MTIKRTPEFRAEAVRIALTSGLMRQQIADDLGIGLSTLGKSPIISAFTGAPRSISVTAGSKEVF